METYHGGRKWSGGDSSKPFLLDSELPDWSGVRWKTFLFNARATVTLDMTEWGPAQVAVYFCINSDRLPLAEWERCTTYVYVPTNRERNLISFTIKGPPAPLNLLGHVPSRQIEANCSVIPHSFFCIMCSLISRHRQSLNIFWIATSAISRNVRDKKIIIL